MGSSDDLAFGKKADAFMEHVLGLLENEDPDELDPDLAMGVLSIEFADRTKCILNRQTAAHQIWLAHGASAWHFAENEAGEWMDTKGRGRLVDVLGEVLSKKLGRSVELGPISGGS
ncbi:MAG: iron donor protein CyaY [Planctomycetota bacterium]|nr:iron donor protein CyaY [Planctomycetota bacterium]MDA0932713.1 iron donor protein CyaY [Planctomycetota bacterium]MDA1222022.1 iron donor protein CyaY [Planctomycetota bacterium]